MTTTEGTTELAYDRLSRLAQVAYPGGALGPPGGACTAPCERFAYDLAGNRTVHVKDGVERRYVLDAADQLTAVTDAASQVLESFTHDGAGRRTSQTAGAATTQYDYDGLGRLTSMARPGYFMFLSYDPLGERARHQGTDGTATYLGDWVETRGGETLRLLHGPGVDDVLAEVTGSGSVRTLARDGSANVTHVAVDGTAEATPRRYEAFGAVRAGSSVVERGFAGRPAEGASGLVYMRARHYDPATGRFLQVDPLGVDATQTYAYANGNPLRFVDPSGRDPISGGLAAGGIPSMHFHSSDLERLKRRRPASEFEPPETCAGFSCATPALRLQQALQDQEPQSDEMTTHALVDLERALDPHISKETKAAALALIIVGSEVATAGLKAVGVLAIAEGTTPLATLVVSPFVGVSIVGGVYLIGTGIENAVRIISSEGGVDIPTPNELLGGHVFPIFVEPAREGRTMESEHEQ